MIPSRWLKIIAPLCLCLVLFVSACTPQTSSRYSQIQKDTTGRGAPTAVAKQAEKGGTFNKFFPAPTGTYEVVPAQEKKGFAEYKLNKDGKTVAMLTVNDTTSVPTAAAKYQNSTEKIAGYPTVDQGTTATGILVNGRYQVKVISRDAAFTKDDRVAWLQKFDLRGLARLKPATETAAAKTQSKNAKAQSKNAKAQPKNNGPFRFPGLNPQPAT